MSKKETYGLFGSPIYEDIPPKEIFINGQQIGDTNPLFEIAKTLHSN